MRLGAGTRQLILCAALAGAAGLLGAALPNRPAWIAQLRPFTSPAPAPDKGRSPPEPAWVASGPGTVEPVSGELRVDALILGRVAEVFVKVNDRVGAGDLIATLDDEQARARLAAAEAQAVLRKQERDAVPVRGVLADLRKAEDGVADAARALAAARSRHDRLIGDRGTPADLEDARKAVAEGVRRLQTARDDLGRRKDATTRAPGARDLALTIARADLAAAEALFEKTRVRAPFAGTILQVPVRAGEIVGPARERPLAVVADLSRLRVRVDLDERNRGQVFVGQAVLVRSESFTEPCRGRVATIAPALVPAQAALGSRRRPQAASVVEVLVEIAGPASLMPGMQVDVFLLASDAG